MIELRAQEAVRRYDDRTGRHLYPMAIATAKYILGEAPTVLSVEDSHE